LVSYLDNIIDTTLSVIVTNDYISIVHVDTCEWVYLILQRVCIRLDHEIFLSRFTNSLIEKINILQDDHMRLNLNPKGVENDFYSKFNMSTVLGT